jgi:hypothetical protein
VDNEQDLSEYEALSFAVSQHRSIAQNEITEKKLLYLCSSCRSEKSGNQKRLLQLIDTEERSPTVPTGFQ